VAISQTKVRSKEKFANITAMMGAVGFVTQIEELLLSSISPPRTLRAFTRLSSHAVSKFAGVVRSYH
jgi:hypothetical protein